MLNARVIFKKETEDAMKKPLSNIKKSELRINKLKELDENGYLASATNRSDVGEMVGLPTRKQAFDWSTRAINKGFLKETIIGFGRGGKAIHEYHFNERKENNMKTKTVTSSQEMFDKLKLLSNTGRLDKAECRADVVRLLGFKDYKTGYTWVVNWIRRGHLKEIPTGELENGRLIAKYKWSGTEPRVYKNTDLAKRRSVMKPVQASNATITPSVIGQITAQTIKIEITKGDMTIKIDATDYDRAGELVKTLLRGA